MTRNLVGNESFTSPLLRRRSLWLAIIASLGMSGVATFVVQQYSPTLAPLPDPVIELPDIKTVTALGRLEPMGKVIQLSAPTLNAGYRVAQLEVKEGDAVKTGQLIAVLDSRDRLQAELGEAIELVKVAQAELSRVRAGAQQGEIMAQQATITRLEAEQQGQLNAQSATIQRFQAEVHNAEAEYKRYQSLYAKGAISASDRDSKQLIFKTAQQQLQEAQAVYSRLQSTRSPELAEAKAKLNQIVEVRPVDIIAAQADVNRAQAAVKKAQAELEQAYIRAPKASVVLDIHTRPGELVGSEGIVELGQTNQLYAIAEVYQSDVSQVQTGQTVEVTSDSLPQSLKGEVDWISPKVRRQSIINTDPSENIDARVVEVYVRLDARSSQLAAGFINLQVNVVIQK